tara:strand:+ start:1956 stop:2225 length:270 start_codon:yes stop_codon:yes gene_type:complete
LKPAASFLFKLPLCGWLERHIRIIQGTIRKQLRDLKKVAEGREPSGDTPGGSRRSAKAELDSERFLNAPSPDVVVTQFGGRGRFRQSSS